MRPEMAPDEALAQRLPLPLAQLYRRAHNARTPLERHHTAYFLWEAALKLLASAAVAEYAEGGPADPRIAAALENLARPSLGHWWQFVRLLVPALAGRGDEAFRGMSECLLGRARDDCPRAAGLDALLRETLEGKGGARATVQVGDLFNRLLTYRNKEIGHGAVGQRRPEFYERMGPALLAGVAEVLARLDVLAGRRLLHVADVRRLASGNWLVERYELHGEMARRLESLEVPEADAARLPRPGRLYLHVPGTETPWRALHPLVVYEAEGGRAFFLNSRQGQLRADYLCYATGEVERRDELGGEQRELLAKVLGGPVDGSVVEAVAERNRAEEPPAPPREPAPGRRCLGEFELISRLGRGGMGVVYRARQPSLGREVALKCLLRTGDPKAEARFTREIYALGRVEHPNLVKVFTSGAEGEQWFYAMELVEGADLAAVCAQLASSTAAELGEDDWTAAVSTAWERQRRQEEPLDGGGPPAEAPAPPGAGASAVGERRGGHGHIAEVVELVRQAVEAAHALHEAGVVHRDIKPGNVMVSADRRHAVLMDLGLAQLQDETQGRRLTQTRQFVGTLRYASPEQLGGATLDRRADVYSLGATLWELLTLCPFLGITDQTPTPDAILKVQQAEPERVRKHNPRVPADLEAIIVKCLEKDRSRRYATAADLAADLGRWQRGEPVLAQPPSLSYLLGKQMRLHRVPLTAAALVLLTAVIGVVTAFLRINDALGREKKAKAEAVENLGRAVQQEKRANEYHDQADRMSALLILKNGAALCKAGDASRGMFSMARSLAICPDSAPNLQREIRTALSSTAPGLHTLEAAFSYPYKTIVTAFSPDGKTLLLGGTDACLVDVPTGRQRVFRQSAHGISGGGFSPDGKLFVTLTRGGVVRIASTATGEDVGEPISHKGTAKWVTFSPDGRTVLVASQFGLSLQGYDVATRRPVSPSFACKDNLYMANYSPDGRRVATAAWENKAQIWDAATGGAIGLPLVHPGVVFSAAFSPDGKTLVTGCLDGGARFWEIETGKPVGPVLPHKGPVRSTVFSRDGRLVLTSSEDGTARLWEVDTGRPVGQLLSHPSELRNALFSPDETYILTAGFEGTARLWRVGRGQALAKVCPQPGAVDAIAFSPDGKRALTGSHGSADRLGESQLWDSATGAPVGAAMSQNGQVMVVAFSPDGKLALTAGNDRYTRLWNTANSTLAQPPWPYGDVVAAAAFSPDGRLVAIGGRGGTVQLREAADGKDVATWQAYDRESVWVWSLAFTPDGRTLLTGGGLAGRLWSVPDGRPIGKSMSHNSEVRTALLSPDGQVVLTCSYDKTARLWSARDGTPLSPPLLHKGDVRGAAFRPDGKVVATASADGTARLWEVPGGRALLPPLFHDGWVRSVAFSPDGKTLVTGDDDGTARLWSADDGAALGAVLQHRGPVNRVAFSPDGTTVLTASSDGTSRLWTPPAPVRGDPAQVTLWVQVLTGMELNAEGTVQLLSADAWEERRQRLQELGGPPSTVP